jgi:hypothetical protein
VGVGGWGCFWARAGELFEEDGGFGEEEEFGDFVFFVFV